MASNVLQQTGSFRMPGKHKWYSENFWVQAMWLIGLEGAGGIAVGEV